MHRPGCLHMSIRTKIEFDWLFDDTMLARLCGGRCDLKVQRGRQADAHDLHIIAPHDHWSSASHSAPRGSANGRPRSSRSSYATRRAAPVANVANSAWVGPTSPAPMTAMPIVSAVAYPLLLIWPA